MAEKPGCRPSGKSGTNPLETVTNDDESQRFTAEAGEEGE